MLNAVKMDLLTALFPLARAEILRRLFLDPSREIYLRELTRQSGLAVRTVQVEAEKLARLGLLVNRRDGNRLYWRANVKCPVFAELQALAAKSSGSSKKTRKRPSTADGSSSSQLVSPSVTMVLNSD